MTFKYTLIIVFWIVIIFFIVRKSKRLAVSVKWPFFLILAGTLANGLEVVIKGNIFDYLDLTKIGIPWPIFNIADTAIVIGLFWLIYKIFKFK